MKLRTLMIVVTAVLVSCKTDEFAGEAPRASALAPLETVEYSQVSREVRQIQVTQGKSGSSASENYSVTSKGIVDIVVVVDNSSSMAEEQRNLSGRLSTLLSAIKDSDWKIMVTTTDPNTNCENSPISKSDANPASRFQSMVTNVGLDKFGIERPILKAAEALKCRSWFQSWLRPDSTVAVLILTDEDNCHIDLASGYGCAGQADRDGKYLIDNLASIRKVGTDARVYGIFWHPSQSQSQCPTALKQANIVADVVKATNGTWGSICDSDYTQTLSKISQDVAQILKADFTLKSIPDPGTLKISVNGQNWTDFVLKGLNVHFTRNPPVGSAITVRYVSGASGVVTNKFDMPEEPADGAITASVSGQPAGVVTYDANGRKAVFSKPPAEGSVITLSFKANTPLKSVFNIAPNADTKHLSVSVNGAPVPPSGYIYDGNTGAITFKVPPPESAKIKIDWRGKKKVG